MQLLNCLSSSTDSGSEGYIYVLSPAAKVIRTITTAASEISGLALQ